MGAAARAGERSGLISDTAFLAFTTGVLGGFTTYSAFNVELFRLVEAGHSRLAVGYLVATVAGAAISGIVGYASARAAVG